MKPKLGIIYAISANAGELCKNKIIELAAANIEIVIFSDPQVEAFAKTKRINDIKEQKNQIAGLLYNGVSVLAQHDVDVIVIAANSVHIAFDELKEKTLINFPKIKLISIVQAVFQECSGIKNIAIFGSSSVINTRLYHEPLEERDLRIIDLTPEEQNIIDKIIGGGYSKELLPALYKEGVKKTIARLESLACEAIILACTELPAVLDFNNFSNCRIVDSSSVLANVAVHHCRKLKSIGRA